VVCALRHWKHLVLGPKVQVRTDHASLQWLRNFKNPENQMARWLHELSQYDIQLVHRAGTKSMNVDALSRRPCSPDCKYCSRRELREEQYALSAQIQVQQSLDWVEEQGKDEVLKLVKQWVTSS
jgi:hypothetical protein